MDATRWQRLSPLLDALLEATPDERASRLRLLRVEDPVRADEVEALLALERGRDDFLAQPVVTLPPGPSAGMRVGPYELDRPLGEGGMGQVWLAHHAEGSYHRRVALKLLRPGIADPGLVARFLRERDIHGRLAHPHIAHLLSAGTSEDGRPYLVLEYVDGIPVTDWCRARQVPVTERLALFAQVCDAVRHAHANLVVHRDLKPSNILVTDDGTVQLLDFGIAKLLGPEAEQGAEPTRTGVRAFTLHYAAPEQLRGEPVTTMTDVYALGVVLYELLADAKPYVPRRDSDAAWEEAILAGHLVAPSQALLRAADDAPDRARAAALRRRARQVAGDLDNIVLKALAREPGARYLSVEALARDVQRFLAGQPVLARPHGVGYRLRKFVARHPWPIASAGIVGLAAAGALAAVLWQARLALQEASRAQAMQSFVTGLFEQAGGAPLNASMELRRLLAAGIERGDSELAAQPLARAELLGLGARLRLSLGDHREADALLDRQVAILDELSDGAPHGLLFEADTLRGHARLDEGEPGACVRTMRPRQAQVEREAAALPLQAAGFLAQLGRCLAAAGDAPAARAALGRALELHAGPLADPYGAIERERELAQLHADAGDVGSALRMVEAALARLRANAGGRHPLVVELLGDVGRFQRLQGEQALGERAHVEALVLALETLGPRHPVTTRARTQLDEARQARADAAP